MTTPRFADGLRLVATRSAITCSRLFVAYTLDKWGAGFLVDEAVLVVDELVTNAVKATGVMDERVRWTEVAHMEFHWALGDAPPLVSAGITKCPETRPHRHFTTTFDSIRDSATTFDDEHHCSKLIIRAVRLVGGDHARSSRTTTHRDLGKDHPRPKR